MQITKDRERLLDEFGREFVRERSSLTYLTRARLAGKLKRSVIT